MKIKTKENGTPTVIQNSKHTLFELLQYMLVFLYSILSKIIFTIDKMMINRYEFDYLSFFLKTFSMLIFIFAYIIKKIYFKRVSYVNLHIPEIFPITLVVAKMVN